MSDDNIIGYTFLSKLLATQDYLESYLAYYKPDRSINPIVEIKSLWIIRESSQLSCKTYFIEINDITPFDFTYKNQKRDCKFLCYSTDKFSAKYKTSRIYLSKDNLCSVEEVLSSIKDKNIKRFLLYNLNLFR